MQVTIHYTRLHGKPLTLCTENLISDNEVRLKTQSTIAPEHRQSFAELWWKADLVPHGHYIASLTKHYFYNDWFDIPELRGDDGQVLGYYSDICTPIKKIGEGNYATTDLILDLWLSPTGQIKEQDWDEFHQAMADKLISPELAAQAQEVFHHLVNDARQGRYLLFYTA
jgi:predicted RNA-binding protein associated with RNAse of E/G family